MAEDFREARKDRQAHRARRVKRVPERLRDAGITFTVMNGGQHLLVMGCIDVWPSSAKWRKRGESKTHEGIDALIAECKRMKEHNGTGLDALRALVRAVEEAGR